MVWSAKNIVPSIHVSLQVLKFMFQTSISQDCSRILSGWSTSRLPCAKGFEWNTKDKEWLSFPDQSPLTKYLVSAEAKAEYKNIQSKHSVPVPQKAPWASTDFQGWDIRGGVVHLYFITHSENLCCEFFQSPNFVNHVRFTTAIMLFLSLHRAMA